VLSSLLLDKACLTSEVRPGSFWRVAHLLPSSSWLFSPASLDKLLHTSRIRVGKSSVVRGRGDLDVWAVLLGRFVAEEFLSAARRFYPGAAQEEVCCLVPLDVALFFVAFCFLGIFVTQQVVTRDLLWARPTVHALILLMPSQHFNCCLLAYHTLTCWWPAFAPYINLVINSLNFIKHTFCDIS